MDVRADGAREQAGDIGHYAVEVKHLKLLRLSAAENEQLPGELSGALRGGLDLPGVRRDLRPVGGPLDDEGSETHDDGEQVVEVVGDPTSQLTAEPFPGRKAAAAISSAQPFEASHVLLADWRS